MFGMPPELTALFIILSIISFFAYWVLGGVFFSLVALLRLGRVRKVRFSCLFSLLALASGIGSSLIGVRYAQGSLTACLLDSTNDAEQIVALVGCGSVAILGTLLIGAAVVVLGGFLIMYLSRTDSEPWIRLDEPTDDEHTHIV